MIIETQTNCVGDYITFETEHGNALVLRRSVDTIARVDGIIFDVDGVLLDVHESIKQVHRLAMGLYFSGLGWSNCQNLMDADDVDAVRLAGGFNSDWDLASATAKLYLLKSLQYGSIDGDVLKPLSPTIDEFAIEIRGLGGGLSSAEAAIRQRCSDSQRKEIASSFDRKKIEQLFMEVYSGDLCPEVYGFEAKTYTGPGMIRCDRAILETELIPKSMKLGIATGRTYGEATIALKLMEWEDIFPLHSVVTEDDGFKKPDPGILRLAVERTGAERSLYIGDTPDDLLTARRYDPSARTMPTCMVLTGLNDPGLMERFMDEGTDMIADNVNAELLALQRCMGGFA